MNPMPLLNKITPQLHQGMSVSYQTRSYTVFCLHILVTVLKGKVVLELNHSKKIEPARSCKISV